MSLSRRRTSDQMEIWLHEIPVDLDAGWWQVCSDCRKAYRRGEHRAVWVTHEDDGTEELVELCPYPDCCAQPHFEAIEWASLARCHPDSLPRLPERGTVYTW